MSSRLAQATRVSAWPIGLVVAAGLGVGIFAGPRQSPPPPAGDGLVRVTVAVERANGTRVTGLTREDFDVVSDGLALPIQYFSAADEPVALVLLLDVSASHPIPGEDLEHAVDGALLKRRTPRDRIGVGGLGRELVLSPRFDTEWPELHRAARLVWDSPRADRVGPSPLWDGVETAVQALEAERGRRAIVMVTDGRSTGNVHGMAEVTTHALLADVSINVIAAPTGMFLRQDETTYARVRPTVLLEQRAGAAGGAYAELRGSEDVAPFLVRGISRLHELYTIGFPPMAWDGRTHGIAVRVKRPGVTVRAKTGYVADRPPQIPPG